MNRDFGTSYSTLEDARSDDAVSCSLLGSTFSKSMSLSESVRVTSELSRLLVPEVILVTMKTVRDLGKWKLSSSPDSKQVEYTFTVEELLPQYEIVWLEIAVFWSAQSENSPDRSINNRQGD